MRIKHAFTARHYRGHGIHSPHLYDFVRHVLVCSRTRDLSDAIGRYYPGLRISEVGDTARLNETVADILIIRPVFRSKFEYSLWKSYRCQVRCQSVWLKGMIVVFLDEKLPNQHFSIRS